MRNLPSIRTTCHKGIDENTDNVSLATCQDARNVWAPDGKVVQRPGFVAVGSRLPNSSTQGDASDVLAYEDVDGSLEVVAAAGNLDLDSLVGRQSGVAGDRWYIGFNSLTITSGTGSGAVITVNSGSSNRIYQKAEYWNGAQWQYMPITETYLGYAAAPGAGGPGVFAVTKWTAATGHLEWSDGTGIMLIFAYPGDWATTSITDTVTSTAYTRYWLRFNLLEGPSDTAFDASVQVGNCGHMKIPNTTVSRGDFVFRAGTLKRYISVTRQSIGGTDYDAYVSTAEATQNDALVYYAAKPTPSGGIASATVVPSDQTAYVALNHVVTQHRLVPSSDDPLPATVEDRDIYVGTGAPYDKELIVQLGSFPRAKFILYHAQRFWAAGIEGEQFVVRWSGKNPYHKVWPSLSWEAIEQDDNSPISALFAHGDQTCVSKHESIWLMRDKGLNALDLREYDAQAIVRGVGVLANRSIKSIRGRSVFLGEDGVYAFDGTPNIEKLSDRIQDTIDKINPGARSLAVAADWKIKGVYLLAVPLNASTTNNHVLVWDYVDDAWWVWEGLAVQSWLVDEGEHDQERVFFTDTAGLLFELGVGRTDNGTAIDAWVETHELGANDYEAKRARCVRIAGSNGQATTTCELRPNGSSLRGVTATIDFSDYNETNRVLAKRMRRPRFKSTGDFFTVKVRNNQKADVFEMSNLALEYQRLGER